MKKFIIFLFMLLVSITTTFLLGVFNEKIAPKLIEVSEQNLNKILF